MRKLNKKIAAVAVGAVALTGTGVAYAYWTTSGTGSGTGSAAAGTASLTFVQNPDAAGNATPVAAMFPGDTAQELKVKVTNTGANDAVVSAVKAYLTISEAHATAGCSAADFLLGGTAAPGAAADARAMNWTAVELAKSSGSAVATSTIQFNNKALSGGAINNQDACKGATVTVNYVAS